MKKSDHREDSKSPKPVETPPKPASAQEAAEKDLPDRMDPEPVAQIVHRGREMGF